LPVGLALQSRITTFNLSPTPKLSLQTHPIVNRYSRPRRSPPPPRPSSTCSRSRAYQRGGRGSLTLKTADGRRGSVLKECRDRFSIVSSSRALLSRAYITGHNCSQLHHHPRRHPEPASRTRTTRPTLTSHDTLQSAWLTACLGTSTDAAGLGLLPRSHEQIVASLE
jgi:hypothetical protein